MLYIEITGLCAAAAIFENFNVLMDFPRYEDQLPYMNYCGGLDGS
jgi:hypothetical protein